jgi:formate/nitrite transporter FocA (FNT family)
VTATDDAGPAPDGAAAEGDDAGASDGASGNEPPKTPAERSADAEPGGERRLAEALDRIVQEGKPRLHRPLSHLLATGAVAGFEVSIGVFALIAVEEATHSPLLGGLAFSFGFIALLLGHSELFTEGFLVPVTVVAAGEASVWDMLRFWLGTAVANLAGGWVMTGIAMAGYPSLHHRAVDAASYFIDSGIGLRSFCMAVMAGAAITLMTRMNNGTDSMPARLVATVATAFVLAGLRMSHSILESLLVFAALHTGHAPFGYLDWLGWFGWTVLGNMVGGIGLVTLLRLVRSRQMIEMHRRETAGRD